MEAPQDAVPPHITVVADGSVRGGSLYLGGGRRAEHERAMAEENAAEAHSINPSAKSALSSVGMGGGPGEAGQGGGRSGSGALELAGAKVSIEEPEYFSWPVYFSSYFKKWKGECARQGPACSMLRHATEGTWGSGGATGQALRSGP